MTHGLELDGAEDGSYQYAKPQGEWNWPLTGQDIQTAASTSRPFPIAQPARSSAADNRRRSRRSEPKYSPHAVDWRFLPEWALVAKDSVRHALVCFINDLALRPQIAPLWAQTIGRRTMTTVKAARILFVHIPKTGGTSISQCLYGRNLPHYTAAFYLNIFPSAVTELPSFSVIRHPVERMMSAHRMALQGGTDIVAYSRYHRLRLKGLNTLESYVDFVFDHRNHLFGLPQELHQQSSFVTDCSKRIAVDRLFSLDAARGMAPQLCQWLGLRAIPHLNATRSDGGKLTARTIGKIQTIYHADFELYERIVSNDGAVDAKGWTIS